MPHLIYLFLVCSCSVGMPGEPVATSGFWSTGNVEQARLPELFCFQLQTLERGSCRQSDLWLHACFRGQHQLHFHWQQQDMYMLHMLDLQHAGL
jgi:hypothetical protein